MALNFKDRRVFIIAEAGINHNGSLEIAKKMVDAAVAAGADAVKFQSFKTEKLVTQALLPAEYQIRNTGSRESQFKMLKKLELPFSAMKGLSKYCKNRSIMFMSSPFDKESVDELVLLGLKCFKIPSGEVTNKPLLQYIAAKNRPIILSTGMSCLYEIKKAVRWIRQIRRKLGIKLQLALLHCVSDYPAKMEDMNLLAIRTLRSVFKLPIGLSDHTTGIEGSIAAVALGAQIIERHFTLDRDMIGPDQKASLEPGELKALVGAIRNIEMAMGDGIKKPKKSEAKLMAIARKSLVAARDIKAGDIITQADIEIKRPGTGLSPEFAERIVNKRIRVSLRKDALFKGGFFVNR